MLTNGQGEWKLNNEGHVVHFKAKHFANIPKVWHHFITSCLFPMTNFCEVTSKRALLNYAIIQDIPFDVSHGLCKQVGVPLEDNEAWIHPIKAIMVKKDKPSVPRPEEIYDSDNEPSNENDLRAY